MTETGLGGERHPGEPPRTSGQFVSKYKKAPGRHQAAQTHEVLYSFIHYEPEREAGTTSIPIPQREESENIPSPDLLEQLENVQQSGNEIAERGMQT